MFCHLWPESLWSGFRCVSDPLLNALQCSVLFSQEKKLSCDGKGIVGAGTRHPVMCPWQKGMKENKVGRITQAAAMLGEGLAWLWLVPTWACNCTKIKWFFPKIITFLSIPLQECLVWELEHIPLLSAAVGSHHALLQSRKTPPVALSFCRQFCNVHHDHWYAVHTSNEPKMQARQPTAAGAVRLCYGGQVVAAAHTYASSACCFHRSKLNQTSVILIGMQVCSCNLEVH